MSATAEEFASKLSVSWPLAMAAAATELTAALFTADSDVALLETKRDADCVQQDEFLRQKASIQPSARCFYAALIASKVAMRALAD